MTLTVKGRGPKTGYSRDQFGDGWESGPGGCDYRQILIRRDLAEVSVLTEDRCVVMSGVLKDRYTGGTFRITAANAATIEIDHVVSLSDAWQKGAARWDSARRRQFANDPMNLQTTTKPINTTKSDGDAATWLPPIAAYRCTYVARQILIKKTYGLTVTTAEKAAMAGVLTGCPAQKPPPASSAIANVDTEATLVDPKPTTAPTSSTPTDSDPETDPQFPTCKAARAAGYGPYFQGKDPEYEWYRDADSDGQVCDR